MLHLKDTVKNVIIKNLLDKPHDNHLKINKQLKKIFRLEDKKRIFRLMRTRVKIQMIKKRAIKSFFKIMKLGLLEKFFISYKKKLKRI